jgi:hypothetical protein
MYLTRVSLPKPMGKTSIMLGDVSIKVLETQSPRETNGEPNHKEEVMSKFIAMLPDETVADDVVKQLDHLSIDNLDWTIIDNANHTRILPAFAWPSGTAGSGGTAPIGGALVANAPEGDVLERDGVDGDDADYFGQAIERGGTAIIVEAPDRYDDQIRATLQQANVDRIVKE